MSSSDQDLNAPPKAATDAVLVPSDELPEGAQKVEEIDFNEFKGKPITVDDIIHRMSNMGFQASSIGDAVKIIDKMVSREYPLSKTDGRGITKHTQSGYGVTQRPATKRPYSWDTRPI